MKETQIALLRGINVGGHRKLPMADLRRIWCGLGAKNPRTYIQSGNAVYEGNLGSHKISAAIEAEFGFRAQTMVLSADQLIKAADNVPFNTDTPKLVHLYFLGEQPDIDPATLSDDANAEEEWLLGDCVFYLHTPNGYGSSKLAERLERRLGVAATARNWNTVSKLVSMATGA